MLLWADGVQDVAMRGSICFSPFLRAYISFIFLIMILAEGLLVFSHICTEFSLTIQNSIPKVTLGASTFLQIKSPFYNKGDCGIVVCFYFNCFFN